MTILRFSKHKSDLHICNALVPLRTAVYTLVRAHVKLYVSTVMAMVLAAVVGQEQK